MLKRMLYYVLLIPYQGKKEQVKRHRPKYRSQYAHCCFCLYVSQFCSAAVSFLPGNVQNIAKYKGRVITFLELDKVNFTFIIL